tara:strand:- start:7062 stop:7637 length:576 start_codon:yes stop_codon:yes gene_type:complete
MSSLKILIIAGSPNVLKKERNLDIYDIIIKMNCVPQDPEYDKYISSRCDIWSFSSHLVVKENQELSPALLESRMKCPMKWVYSGKQWQQNTFLRSWSKQHKNINPFQIINRKKCLDFQKKHNFQLPLSTGISTIIHAMNQYNDITLLGFTHNQEETPHFYDSNGTKPSHDFPREKQLIEGWINEGKLKKID